MNRVKDLPDMYDSDEDGKYGPGGLLQVKPEMEDFGEEALSYKKAIDRALRRLYREENAFLPSGSLKHFGKGKRKIQGYAEDDEKDGGSRKRRKDERNRTLMFDESRAGDRREGGLDAIDLQLLGEGQEEEEELDEESGIDESEDGEMTKDEVMNEG